MNPILRNILGVILGIVIGGTVNMLLINISASIIPPPNGADVTTMEGLLEALPLFEPKHFIMPFLAHAMGTLIGALIASLIAVSHRMYFGIGIGAFYLLGGIANSFLLPAPTWFIAVDLIGAYIPMGILGWKLAVTMRKGSR